MSVPDPVSRKRGRYTHNACNECKRRKLKCSGGDICGRCALSNIPCVYAVQSRPPTEENQAMSQFKFLEDRMFAMQEQLDRMSAEIKELRRRSQPFQHHNRVVGSIKESNDSRWASRDPISPSYIGPTSSEFGLNVPGSDEVPDTDEAGSIDVQQTSPPGFHASLQPFEQLQENAESSRSNPLIQLDKSEALRLVDIYEQAIGLMYPLVDLDSIRQFIRDKFDPRLNNAASLDNIPQSGDEDWWFSARDAEVLKIVLALALISDSQFQSELGNSLAASAEDTFARTRTQVPEVDMKELTILALVALYHSIRDDYTLAWRTIGLAARGAMQMGLHRCDTWLRTGGIFPGDLERSRAVNLFWCIYVFDKEFSFETGLPFGMRDSDMDSSLPEPSPDHIYLRCMITYCRLGGRIWDIVVGWGSTAKAVTSDDSSLLIFQIQQWQDSIPFEYRVVGMNDGHTPPVENTNFAIPRILLHLRANQMRILVYKHNLLSSQSIRENIASANCAVENATNTIQLLSKSSYVSAIYLRKPQPFNRFLFSALATLFLAILHSPDDFLDVCRHTFFEAVNTLKISSARGRNFRRLGKVLRNLKQVKIGRQAAPPSADSHSTLAMDYSTQNSHSVSPGAQAAFDPSDKSKEHVTGITSVSNDELLSNELSDLTNFFEFAGDFFMDFPTGLESDMDGAVDATNGSLQQYNNTLDVLQREDETVTRLMMGLL